MVFGECFLNYFSGKLLFEHFHDAPSSSPKVFFGAVLCTGELISWPGNLRHREVRNYIARTGE